MASDRALRASGDALLSRLDRADGDRARNEAGLEPKGTKMIASETSILAVDDDACLTELVAEILKREGFAVETANSGNAALQVLTGGSIRFHLLLLDLNMPALDGFATCRRIRHFSKIPVILLTGRKSESDKVRGFESGADDYIVKPFSPFELVARVRAVLRRVETVGISEPPADTFTSGDLVVDFAHCVVRVANNPIVLSPTEYRLLAVLARNAGRLLTSNQILREVWGYEYIGESHLLRVTLGRLRRRLGDDARNPRIILTRPGLGYRMIKERSA